MKKPYTKDEKKIMSYLIKAYNIFAKTKSTHPSHKHDFTDGIHKCQDIIIHRIVQRDYPKEFPVIEE